MSDEIELLPCPFCGTIPEYDVLGGSDELTVIAIKCRDADCILYDCDPITFVQKNAWNRRAEALRLQLPKGGKMDAQLVDGVWRPVPWAGEAAREDIEALRKRVEALEKAEL